MSLQFQCPSCHTLLSISNDKSGSVVACGRCHKDLVVPHVSAPVAVPVPEIQIVPAVKLIRITCPFCGITGEIPDRGGSHLKPIKCRQCGTRFQPQAPTSSVSPPVKLIDDELLPYIEPEPLRDQKSQRGNPLRIDLATVGIIGLVFIVGGLIFFNLPADEGRKGNGPAVVRPKGEIQAQPGDSESDPFAFDGKVAGGLFLLLVLVVLGSLLYVLPTIIAAIRGHQNVAAIAVLNILLGWAFIGWVGALVWAFTEVRSREHHHYHR